MVLKMKFVILGIRVKLGNRKNPQTGYVELKFGTYLDDPIFRQELVCKVPFAELLKSNSFNQDIKNRIITFANSSYPFDKQTTADWVKLSNMLISKFQYNSSTILTFLPLRALK